MHGGGSTPCLPLQHTATTFMVVCTQAGVEAPKMPTTDTTWREVQHDDVSDAPVPKVGPEDDLTTLSDEQLVCLFHSASNLVNEIGVYGPKDTQRLADTATTLRDRGYAVYEDGGEVFAQSDDHVGGDA